MLIKIYSGLLEISPSNDILIFKLYNYKMVDKTKSSQSSNLTRDQLFKQ